MKCKCIISLLVITLILSNFFNVFAVDFIDKFDAEYTSNLSTELPEMLIEINHQYEDITTFPQYTKPDLAPIFRIYKDGYPVGFPVSLQYLIRQYAEEYNIPEKLIIGCALAESTMQVDAVNDAGTTFGLFQISKFWIGGANIEHFTEDFKDRDLLNAEDSLLTLMEIWYYAIEEYEIDISTTQGLKDLLYWHNSGRYQKGINWNYSNKIIGYMNEVIIL